MSRAAVGAARIEMSINSVQFAKQLERAEKATKRWKSSLRRTEREFMKTGRSLERTGKTMMKTVTGPIAGLITGLVALQRRTGQYADELLDLEQITGINTDALQEWRNVARIAGVETNALSNAASGLSRRMNGISEESGAAFEAAQQLGISFKDAEGNIRDTDEVMGEAIARLSEMEPGLERAALAGDLFGRRWEQIAPILGMTSMEIENARNQAHQLGLVMDREALEAANKFWKEMGQLRDQFAAVGRQLASDLIPLTREHLIPVLQDAITAVGTLTRKFAELDKEVHESVINWGLKAAAIGPVIWATGKLFVISSKLLKFFRKLVFVKGVLIVKLGLIATAVGAVVVAGRNLIDNWELHAAEFNHLLSQMQWAASRMAFRVANALHTVGLVSEDTLTQISKDSAQARFDMLRAGYAADDARRNMVGFGESARNLLDDIKSVGASLKATTLEFLGLSASAREAAFDINRVADRIAQFGEGVDRTKINLEVVPPDLTKVDEEFIKPLDEMVKRATSRWQQMNAQLREMGVDITGFFAGEVSNAIIGFADAMGQRIAGVADEWSTSFEKIILTVLDFAQSLARLAAAIGGVMLFIPGMQGMGAGLLAAAAALQVAVSASRGLLQRRADQRRDRAQQAPGMASGGIVPRGFPNDTYPAMLTSGERVIPDPLPLDSGMGGSNKDLNIHLTGRLVTEAGQIVAVIDDYVRGLR